MNLNKLTKKELVEHAKSLDIFLDIESTKDSLIDSLNKYEYIKCAGCAKKITDDYYGYDDRYEKMHYVHRHILNLDDIKLCEACYNEWSDIPKGFKLEVNPSTGGLWNRPLSKKEKSAIRADKLIDPEFLIGWWIKGCGILILIAVIYQFF